MKLYHGTSTRYLPGILQHGLRPRGRKKGNWRGKVASKPTLVYLTDAYPVYYAVAATSRSFEPVVLEVEVDESELFPDEDFLAHLAVEDDRRNGREPLDLKDYIATIDPTQAPDLAIASLRFNGVAAVGPIDPEQITRHVVLQNDYRVMFIGADATPTPKTYGLMGPMYRKCVQVLFDEGVDAAVEIGRAGIGPWISARFNGKAKGEPCPT